MAVASLLPGAAYVVVVVVVTNVPPTEAYKAWLASYVLYITRQSRQLYPSPSLTCDVKQELQV